MQNSTHRKAKICPIAHFKDNRGDLNVLQFNQIPPFEVKRIFYTYNVEHHIRGEHAHICCEQFLIAVNGSLKVAVDNGIDRDIFTLNTPGNGLYLPAGLWAEEYDYSAGAVLLVLASHDYDPADYIRDYQKFLEYVKGQ